MLLRPLMPSEIFIQFDSPIYSTRSTNSESSSKDQGYFDSAGSSSRRHLSRQFSDDLLSKKDAILDQLPASNLFTSFISSSSSCDVQIFYFLLWTVDLNKYYFTAESSESIAMFILMS